MKSTDNRLPVLRNGIVNTGNNGMQCDGLRNAAFGYGNGIADSCGFNRTADDTAVVIENVRIMRFESDFQSPKFFKI